jgi:phospholipid-binding lipoprotein MlaA
MRARGVSRSLVLAVIAALAAAPWPARASDGPEPGVAAAPEVEPQPVELEDDPLFDDAEEEDLLGGSSNRDPFEELNREVFSFNRGVDRWFFNPVTRGYQRVVPPPGRRAIYRVFQNLDSPVILANQMLQFRVVDSAGTLTRFIINSSFGIGGLFDPAADFFEVYRREADFGQTLARYGSPSGPYLMLPIFGPSTLRDVFGDVVDLVADPVSYVLGPVRWYTLVLGGGEGLTTREAHFEELESLEAGSVDFYSALRSAYLQSRDAMVREARGASAVNGTWIAMPR